jgi:phosphohistidine phosphatase
LLITRLSENYFIFIQTIVLKTLLIIRHAKSDQSFFGNDFERPLNERGKNDAPEMAKRVLDRNIAIDSFVASPAKRAKKTAELFCETYKQKIDNINFISALYHAPAREFYEVIKTLADSLNTIAIFAHNPGISYFVNELVENVRVDNMPTCAIFAVQIDISQWKDFAKAKKEFLFFDYPKNG